MFGHNFTNRTIRKYVIYFGHLFSSIQLTRDDQDGLRVQQMKVPLNYGPKEKFLARLEGNDDLRREIAIQLPRMSFEITGFNYDPARKLSSVGKCITANGDGSGQFQYNPVPYNIDFNLYIMTKNVEDGTRIVEQILPYFLPMLQRTLNINPDLGEAGYDVPLILNSVDNTDSYQGPFEQRRAIIWTLTFTMKAWMFGPTRTSSVITQVEINTKIPEGKSVWDAGSDTPNSVELVVTPGLTIDGDPTTDKNLTIDRNLIKSTDNYAYILDYEENI